MGEHREITTKVLWLGEDIAAGTTVTTKSLDLGGYAQSGFFSIHYHVTGTGTLALSFRLSNDGVNFVDSTNGYKITTGLTAASGAAADGKDLISFAPTPAARMKINAFETGGVNAVGVTVYLAVQ